MKELKFQIFFYSSSTKTPWKWRFKMKEFLYVIFIMMDVSLKWSKSKKNLCCKKVLCKFNFFSPCVQSLARGIREKIYCGSKNLRKMKREKVLCIIGNCDKLSYFIKKVVETFRIAIFVINLKLNWVNFKELL